MSGIHTDDHISSTKTTIIIHVAVARILISQEWVIVKLCAIRMPRVINEENKKLILHLSQGSKAWKEAIVTDQINIINIKTQQKEAAVQMYGDEDRSIDKQTNEQRMEDAVQK